METLPLPSQERVRYLFYYNEKTGAFYARFKAPNRKIGQRGNSLPSGYKRWFVDGKSFLEHRLIWMYVYGEDPDDLEIDHRDLNKSNNKLENLRVATHGQNMANQDLKGYQLTKSGRWSARLMVDKEVFCLGTFKTEEEAHNAYQNAKLKLRGEFA